MQRPQGKTLWIVSSLAAAMLIAGIFGSWGRLSPSHRRVCLDPAAARAVRELIDWNLGRIPQVIEVFERRRLTTEDSPWTLYHGLLGRGRDYHIATNSGSEVSCMDWLLRQASWRSLFEGTNLVRKGREGFSFVANDCPGADGRFEGHLCQWLWVLSECGLEPDRVEVRTPPDGEVVTLQDLLETSEAQINEYSDLSWALPVLARWARKSEWRNSFGDPYSLDKLVRQHLDREDSCGACFGTHWRMGLAEGVVLAGDAVSPESRERARLRLRQAVHQARLSQAETGQFVLKWGVYPAMPEVSGQVPELPSEETDLIAHQGHMLAWLMAALSDDELAEAEWPSRAARWLVDRLLADTQHVRYGAHAHAIHALRLYVGRVVGPMPFPAAGCRVAGRRGG